MAQNGRFYVDGYLLKILDSAYLVEVEPANGRTGRYEKPRNLPQWIFRSPHAIWLMQEGTSLFDRATKGEKVKQQIMNSVPPAARGLRRESRRDVGVTNLAVSKAPE